MPVFKRSKDKEEVELTKKTVLLGGGTFVIFLVIFIFGLPLLIRFSVYLAERKKESSPNSALVLPPQPPRIVLPFEATSSAFVTIRGYAEKGSNVELDIPGGKKLKKSVDDEGEFVFEKVDLQPGPNVFSGIAMFSDELKSEKSKLVTIIRDETPPSLELTNPSEEKVTVDTPDFDLIGKTESRVLVNVNAYVATVNDKGEFKLKLQLQPGKNEYSVVAKDMAGNETKKKVIITYDF